MPTCISNPEPVVRYIMTVRLYRGDFIELRDMLVDKCKHVMFRTRRFEYNPEDIGNQNCEDQISDLHVSTLEPTVRVDFELNKVVIFTIGRHPADVGLAHMIVSFLNKKTSWIRKVIAGTAPWILSTALVFMCIPYMLQYANQNKISEIWFYVIALLLYSVLGFTIAWMFKLERNRLYLISGRQNVLWFARNRDVAVMLASVFLGALATVVINHFQK